MTLSIITVDMIEACRAKMQGVIVADRDDNPEVRSEIHYDGPDPLHDGSGDQIVVLRADELSSGDPDLTDEEIAEFLTQCWPDLVLAMRDREEQGR